MHQRKAIRKAVQALLLDKTEAQDRVFTTREVPWKTTELPGISVYAIEEASEPLNLAGDLSRALSLAILIVTSSAGAAAARVDDDLDDRAEEVEKLLAADPTLGGTALGSYLSSSAMDTGEEQGRPVGVARLTYTVTYSNPEG